MDFGASYKVLGYVEVMSGEIPSGAILKLNLKNLKIQCMKSPTDFPKEPQYLLFSVSP